ncbi:1-deoxy-D-xylulose-5-phosphate synthase [Psychromonas antarctica]|jgi:1-deoxy-D-xylulose-5-phosphate synthase|uniref:1-deoxy-D-xylulose-5-phosphate synthase n=1 Tax=Psychromonas antarctica TaxID=67573 RepID=UPI001EE80729|nr:1-deoxy-D-xylulose-5-phosphate synthase [Psychromonas antarctica]MCG6200460.1 1-deoxy-D-xylulose-5-phosphate synthase [Psychromonas antarctica]
MPLDLKNYPLLASVNYPEDLRLLKKQQLPKFCDELRLFLLNSVSQSSGHLASGLGVVELTVALHYVYNTPFDHLIFDVGHQAYPHKILTGRRDKMSSIRTFKGLHPFPWREESEYDVLSVGHSSTSIGAALGMSIAAEKEQLGRKVVAVIGDGAITAGMAFEALNHAGALHNDMLVVLNDNEMSISENVGALNNHLAKILSGDLYTQLREGSKKVLSTIPPIKALAKRTEEHIKGMVSPATIFEEFGFNYIGPMDGHNVIDLVDTLRNMRNHSGPQFLHIMTKKGKGYKQAELDPILYHAVPKFTPDQALPKSAPSSPTFSQVFGDWLNDMADHDDKLAAITPAMSEGSGMVSFSKRHPDKFYDVAIAEQHAVTLATGMAIAGLHPVVAIYSSFLQRAYDQLIHDVAIQNQGVLFAIDRAGIVGADGPTHQGAYDLSFLRCVPNMVVMAPSDEQECRNMLYTGYLLERPAAVRYPRGVGSGIKVDKQMKKLPIGEAKIIYEGQNMAILCFGTLLQQALPVAHKLGATLVDMRFVKPIDKLLLDRLSSTHTQFVTLEENSIAGGAGSSVNEYFMAQKINIPVLNLGLPDQFIEQGTQKEIYQLLGLDSDGIEKQIKAYFA